MPEFTWIKSPTEHPPQGTAKESAVNGVLRVYPAEGEMRIAKKDAREAAGGV